MSSMNVNINGKYWIGAVRRDATSNSLTELRHNLPQTNSKRDRRANVEKFNFRSACIRRLITPSSNVWLL